MKFESTGGVRREDPHQFVDLFEKSRIQTGEDFSDLYSDFQRDMQRAAQAEAAFSTPQEEALPTGKVAEGLIFSLLQEGRISEHLDFRTVHPYDDYFHGVDMVVEPKRTALPALATLDITINQEDIKGRERFGTEYEESRPVGLEQKLRRAKDYIDNLVRFDPTRARDLLGWIQSGGLHEKHSGENDSLFKEAERVMLMKYYRSPASSNEPNQPGYVIGGPLSVVSVDAVFVNRALQGSVQAKETLRAVSFLEFVYGILAEQQYLDALVRIRPEKNLLFDTHFSKVQAWSRILQQSEITDVVETLLKEQGRNQDFADQFSYYRSALTKVFGIR